MPIMTTGDSDSSVDVLVRTTADTAGATATTAALDDMGAKAKAQADSSAASFEKFNNTLGGVSSAATKVGDSMTKYVSLPIAGVAAESLKMAVDFQQTMELLHTQAGTAQKDIAGLSASVLALAPTVGEGPDQLATAFYHIASAGNGIWSTAQQLNILKIAAEGAKIGQADLNDTTYSLTSALASNVKGASGAAQMMATLNAIVGSGDMHMQDLNAAIGTGFLGTAESFGISIQSVGAALSTLTDNGEHADAAATRLRMTWALMTAPSKQAAGLLGEMGLTAEQAGAATSSMNDIFSKTGLTTTKLADDLRQPNGMYVALKDLQTQLEKSGLTASETDAVLSKTFGGGRTDAALLTMLGNLDRMNDKFQLINANTSQFGADWAAQQQTSKQQFDEAWSGIEASLIKLGDEIMPEATKLMKEFSGDIQDVSNWFGHLTGGEQDFILKTLALTAVVGPSILILGKMGSAVSDVGDLFLKSGKAMGLFKTEGLVAEAAKGASALGEGGGLEGAAAEALPEVGGLAAALGPLALGIGAVAAVGIGGAIVVKKLSDDHKEAAAKAATQATAENNVASSVLKAGGAHALAAKEIDGYKSAADKATASTNKMLNALDLATTRSDQYKASQENAQATLKKYGPDSAQYIASVEQEAKAATASGNATDAYKKLLEQSKLSHDQVTAAVKNLSGSYVINSLTTGKVSSDSNNLTKAKNTEKKAHQDVKDAVLDYNAAIKLSGPNSKSAQDEAKNLTEKKNDEAKAQQGVSYWTKQVSSDLTNERNEADKLSSSIDNLASKNTKLTSILSKTSSNGKLPQFASGVQNFQGGLAIVGEEGPELAYLPQGTNVVPAGQTASMLGGSGGGTTTSSGTGQSITIQQMVVQAPNNATLQSILASVDQDNLLVGRGMTPNRGTR
jgi:TP901 family phage tail tape measure protein